LLFDRDTSDGAIQDYLDNQTWNDLNMDRLYAKIDRTYTEPGEAVLYRILREPQFKQAVLKERSLIIGILEKDHPLRERIQLLLLRCGRSNIKNNLFNQLWDRQYPRVNLGWVITALAICALGLPIAAIVTQSLTLIIPMVVLFLINLFIHYFIKYSKKIDSYSFNYLISTVVTAQKIGTLKDRDLAGRLSRIATLYKEVSGIIQKPRFLFSFNKGSIDPLLGALADYLNILFLQELRSYSHISRSVTRYTDKLRELYFLVGELDALTSIASYRASLDSYSEPQLQAESVVLELQAARHPLIERPVPTSITTDKRGIIITGSNMSGKSTFLRNIGVNVIMAQTIYTTLCSHYSGSFFRVITSIGRSDDLLAGESFYYAEAQRILKALRSIDNRIPTLCIIDEKLSATNSTERLQASEAIVRYLVKQNTLAVIATHDIELVERLNGLCDLYHFSDKVDDSGLKFDYRLKPGIATTRNAIALLKYLGYPQEIIEAALNEPPADVKYGD
jgi:DNA mismatch repair ATPase MutS